MGERQTYIATSVARHLLELECPKSQYHMLSSPFSQLVNIFHFSQVTCSVAFEINMLLTNSLAAVCKIRKLIP
jgi:hypothetical protein